MRLSTAQTSSTKAANSRFMCKFEVCIALVGKYTIINVKQDCSNTSTMKSADTVL